MGGGSAGMGDGGIGTGGQIDVLNVRRAFVKANIANPLFVAENGLEALEIRRNGQMPTQNPLPVF